MVILQLQRMFYGRYPSLSDFVRLFISPTFFWDAKHGLLPDRFTCPLLWSGLLFYQVCNPDGLADALWGRLLVTAHSLSFTGGIAFCVIKKD